MTTKDCVFYILVLPRPYGEWLNENLGPSQYKNVALPYRDPHVKDKTV